MHASMAPGAAVQVYGFGKWYGGVVVSVGRTRYAVRFTTGTGKERVKSVPLSHLAPAGTYREATMGEPGPGLAVWGDDAIKAVR